MTGVLGFWVRGQYDQITRPRLDLDHDLRVDQPAEPWNEPDPNPMPHLRLFRRSRCRA